MITIDNRTEAEELLKLLTEARELTRSRRIYASASFFVGLLESQLKLDTHDFILSPFLDLPETEQ